MRALERVTRRGLLWVVNPHSVSPGSVVGGVASAATTGALIAIGHRVGSIDLPFAAIGALFLRRTLSGREAWLVAVGFVLHLIAVCLWSALALWLVRHARWRVWVGAAASAAGQFVLSWAVAGATGRGVASVLTLGDRVVLATVLGFAIGAGLLVARSDTDARDDALTNGVRSL